MQSHSFRETQNGIIFQRNNNINFRILRIGVDGSHIGMLCFFVYIHVILLYAHLTNENLHNWMQNRTIQPLFLIYLKFIDFQWQIYGYKKILL